MFIAGSIQSQESIDETLLAIRTVGERIRRDKRFARKFMRMLDEAAGRIPPPSHRTTKARRATINGHTKAASRS